MEIVDNNVVHVQCTFNLEVNCLIGYSKETGILVDKEVKKVVIVKF